MVLLVLAAACGGDGGDDVIGADEAVEGSRDALTPEFGSSTTSAAAGDAPTTIVVGGSAAVPTTATTAIPASADGVLTASVEDHAGDVSSAAGAPPWADLLGARVTRARDGFELRVRLAGGTTPERSPDDNTMNVASFFDLDDDGVVDYEIWANLGPDGWGASYYEGESGAAYHGAQSFVEVVPEGDEVVLRFALVHLDRAESFRWSIASEWGPYESIGTDAMARDQAPDVGASTAFPS